ncbi:MAG: hypothetical protein QN157_13840 [Armatimonadota bacterium]|nr:hypothetical protein [Armatimonadota bacterium]
MRRTVDDPPAKWLGLAVFLLGAAFLVAVFVMAYRDVVASGVLGRVTAAGQAAEPGPALVTLAIKGVLLIVMAVAGGALANRGIGLYAAARGSDEG